MSAPRLNLIVLRSLDIDRAAAFYRVLGLHFTRHSHGNGPEHYSSENGDLVFEIYPYTDGPLPNSPARIGFSVDSVDELCPLLIEAGAVSFGSPKDSPWGRRAIIKDIDGNVVELISRKHLPLRA